MFKNSVLASAAFAALCAVATLAGAQPAQPLPAEPAVAVGQVGGASVLSSLDFTATGPTAIPDNNATGLDVAFTVAAPFCVGDLNVSVNISHTFRGDLTLDLISPMGTSVRLHNRSGGSADNIVRTYDQQRTVVGSFRPDGPGSLDTFNGQPSVGTWILRIADRAQLDFGTFNSATLRFAASATLCPPVAFDAQHNVGAHFDPGLPTSVNIPLTGESPLQTPVGFSVTSLPQFGELSVVIPSGGPGPGGDGGEGERSGSASIVNQAGSGFVLVLTSGDLPFSLPGTDNVVIYSPNLGYIGSDSFTFRAQDNNGTSPNATISIEVGTPEIVTGWSMEVNPGWTFQGLWSWGIPAGLDGDPDSGLTSQGRAGLTVRTPVVGYNLGTAPGNIDLITSSELSFRRGFETAALGVRRNDGSGDFGQRSLFTFECLGELLSFDVNNDGIEDLILVDGCESSLHIRLGQAGGGFAPQQTTEAGFFCPDRLGVADLNSDQFPDLYARDFCDFGIVKVLLNDGQGSFSVAPQSIEVNVFCQNQQGVPGDVDLDGDTDLVLIDSCANAMIVVFNNGAGVFTRFASYPTGSCPSVPLLKDLNGDDALDVLVRSDCDRYYQVFLNSGDGTFTSEGQQFGENLPVNYTDLVDIDVDGDLDVIATEFCDGVDCTPAVRVLVNNGNADFAADPVSYAFIGSSNSTRPLFADLNDDGAPDMAIAEYDVDTLRVFLHKPINTMRGTAPAGFFLAPQSYVAGDCVEDIFARDLNDDTILDLLVSSSCGDSAFTSFINDGDGLFGGVVADGAVPCIEDPIFVDFDGAPGIDVLVTGDCDEQISLFTNNGQGALAAEVSSYLVEVDIDESISVEEIAGGDFNNDGLTDIVMLDNDDGYVIVVSDVSESNQIEFNFRGESFSNGILFVGQVQCPVDVTVADFNNDGLSDFVVIDDCSGEIVPFINDPFEPGYFYGSSIFAGECISSIASADVDNDSNTDFVVYNYCEDGFLVYLNSFTVEPPDEDTRLEQHAALGGVSFDEPLFFDAGSNCLGRLRLADFNGDDLQDIISADECAGGLVVYLNEASSPDEPSFSSRPEFFPIAGDCLDHIETADLNEDGVSDIVVLNCELGRAEVFFGSTSPTGRQANLSLPAGLDPEGLALADLNDDQLIDIAVTNEDSNDLSVFLSLGEGQFGPEARYPFGSNPSGLVAGRVNSGGVSSLFNDSNNDGEADGLYENNLTAPSYATTPPVDLSNFVRATLTFQRWLGVEKSRFDKAGIEISVDGGTTWQPIWTNPDVTINETAWSSQSYDISAIADRQADVRFRWSMGPTDESTTFHGWNLDDVAITGVFAPLPQLPVQMLGDADRNGTVNFDDLTTVLSNFGTSYLTGDSAMGDADYNSTVNFDDLTAVLSNFGARSNAR